MRGQRGERGKSNELNLSNGKYIFVGAERILFFFSLLLLFFFHNGEKVVPFEILSAFSVS